MPVDGGIIDDRGRAIAEGKDGGDAADAGIDEDDGKMPVTDEVSESIGGAEDEDGGGAGREGNAVLEDPEKNDGVVRVDVEATAGPVCDNAMKGAMTDGGKNGIDGPGSAARPDADPWSVSPPE